jgi:hypothetical protein
MSRILEKADEGKVSILSFEMRGIEFQRKKQNNENFLIVFRQTVELVQFVGWLQNQFPKEITARNQMFGHLELLVCEFSQFLVSFHFISFHNLM